MESCCMHTMESIVYALNNAMHGMTTVVDHFVEWGNTFLDFCSIFYSRYEDRECRIKIVQLPLLCAFVHTLRIRYQSSWMLAAAAVETPPSCVTHRQPATIRNGMVNIEHEIACCMLNTQQYTLPRNPETRTNENGGQVSSVSHSVARNAYNKLAASCLTINHICPFFEYGSVVFCLRRRRCCRFQVFSFYLLVYIYIYAMWRDTQCTMHVQYAHIDTHTQCEWEPFIDWILCRWYANCKSPNTNNRGMALWFERTKTWSRKREREHWPFRYSLLCFATPVLVQACIQFFAKMPHPPRP